MNKFLLFSCLLIAGCASYSSSFDEYTGNNLQRLTGNDREVALRETFAGGHQIKIYPKGDLFSPPRTVDIPSSIKNPSISGAMALRDSATLILMRSDEQTVCGWTVTIILVTEDSIQSMEDANCRKMEYGNFSSRPGAVLYRTADPQKNIPVWVIENGQLFYESDERLKGNSTSKGNTKVYAHTGEILPSTGKGVGQANFTKQVRQTTRLQRVDMTIPQKVSEAGEESKKVMVDIRVEK